MNETAMAEDEATCAHQYESIWDGEGIWCRFRGMFCIHCGEPEPWDGEEVGA